MDGLLALYIYLLTGLAKFSRPLSVIGFGEYREWHPGEKLKILLVGYNGARNADRWKEKHPEVELNFEKWDCYSGEVPEGLDVFVFDTISLDSFAEGMRAYIGYSEAMNEMGESASDMDFRLFSMTDSKNIPVFYVDAAAINAKISSKKRALALDLLNIITGTDALARAQTNGGSPQYLLSARYSIYDAMASDYPLYEELKKIASVPDAFVFRIKPDGNDYLEEAEKNKDAMLPLMK